MSETSQYVVEIPLPGSSPTIPSKVRYGQLEVLWAEGEWAPACFLPDGTWTWARETPPCPATFFASKEEAEAKLRQTQRRSEVYAAATGTALSPYLLVGRVVEAASLEVKRDFEAEVLSEKRAAKLAALREAEEKAIAAREAEESELAQLRQDARSDVDRLKQEGTTESTDWASVGGLPKIQSRRRADGSEVFRARVAGDISPTFEDVAEAVAWRDERSTDDAPPVLIGRSEGSRPADD